MISWTVAAPPIVTGVTSSLLTSSFSFTGSYVDTSPGASGTYQESRSNTLYSFAYTSIGNDGTTTCVSSSLSETVWATDENGTTTESYSLPENTSDIVQSTVALVPSTYVQTTTTVATKTSTAHSGLSSFVGVGTTFVYSTSSSYDQEASQSTTEWAEITVPKTEWAPSTVSLNIQETVTTTSSQTTRAPEAHTIWQANTARNLTDANSAAEVDRKSVV